MVAAPGMARLEAVRVQRIQAERMAAVKAAQREAASFEAEHAREVRQVTQQDGDEWVHQQRRQQRRGLSSAPRLSGSSGPLSRRKNQFAHLTGGGKLPPLPSQRAQSASSIQSSSSILGAVQGLESLKENMQQRRQSAASVAKVVGAHEECIQRRLTPSRAKTSSD